MKKLIAIIICICSFFSLLCGCTVHIKDDAVRYAFKEGNTVGAIVPSYYKLEKEADIPLTESETAKIRIAKNDIGSIQFAIRNNTADIISVKGTKGSFTSEDGAITLDDSFTELYREYFIYIKSTAEKVSYPDPLVPLNETNNSITVKKGENCVFWFDVRVDTDTPAGIYNGSFTVSFENGEFIVPVEITVEDITLPVVPTLKSYGAIFSHPSSVYTDRTKEEQSALYDDMYEKLLDARFCPNALEKYRWDFYTVEDYANYLIEHMNSDPRIQLTRVSYYNLDDLSRLCELMDAAGHLDKCFIYPYDEPTSGMIEAINEDIDKIAAAAPGLNILICTNSYHPDLLGHLNFWCSTTNITQNPNWSQQILNSGARFWEYGTCFGGGIAENGLMNSEKEFYNLNHNDYLEGMLNWSIYHSGQYDSINNEYLTWNRDMWNDPYCFLPGEQWDPLGGGATYFYPGMKGDGIVNEDTYVESIRLRYITEGFEAYELLEIRKSQINEIINDLGIQDEISAVDAMNFYYDNAKNSFDKVSYTQGIDSAAFSDYDYLMNRLMSDILNHKNNKTSLTVITEYAADTLFYLRKLKVFAKSGAEVNIQGVSVTGEDIGNGTSVYVTDVEAKDSSNVIKVEIDGVETEYTVAARAVNTKNSVSLFGGEITQEQFEAISKTNARINPSSTYSDGRIFIDLSEEQYSFKFADCGFNSKLSGTHLAITLRNETSNFIMKFALRVSTNMASQQCEIPVIIDPGKEDTIYISFNFCTQFNIRQINKISFLPISNTSDYRISVTDIEVVTIK